jgi:hypothetical protein
MSNADDHERQDTKERALLRFLLSKPRLASFEAVLLVRLEHASRVAAR